MLAAKCAASLDRPAGGGKRCLAGRRRRCRAGRARARSLAWPFLCEDARRLVLSQIEAPRHGLPPGVQVGFPPPDRSETRRVGKEWVSPGRSRWSRAHKKKNKTKQKRAK